MFLLVFFKVFTPTIVNIDPVILRRRSSYPVCSNVLCRPAFANRQFHALSSFVYNKIHKILNVYDLCAFETKKKKCKWLQTQNNEIKIVIKMLYFISNKILVLTVDGAS